MIDYQMPPTQYFENYKHNIEKWLFRGAVGEKRRDVKMVDRTLPWVGKAGAQVSSHKAGCSRSWKEKKSAIFTGITFSPVQSAQHFIYRLVRALVPVTGFITISVIDITGMPGIPLV